MGPVGRSRRHKVRGAGAAARGGQAAGPPRRAGQPPPPRQASAQAEAGGTALALPHAGRGGGGEPRRGGAEHAVHRRDRGVHGRLQRRRRAATAQENSSCRSSLYVKPSDYDTQSSDFNLLSYHWVMSPP